ncbi:MAG: HEAT repeat domain-containing protein [Bryobacterales bacterium]|nr:HEAT repeat domain-containing protein [Bryobacterales bacterium]MBV9399678.1 HEAT repeat domain-containing protein [Bryobacterales bacterium]
MTCEETKQLFADYWSDGLNGEDEIKLQEHLGACEGCRKEAERLGALWRDLGALPAEQPGPGLRSRFYDSLAAFRSGADDRFSQPSHRSPAKQMVWQIAAGIALLLAGVGAGYGLRPNQSPELSQLREEVANMRQLVALSLLQQQSASERLRGVSYALRAEPNDSEVLGALLDTVKRDSNVNVRLAAVDALHPFASSPATRNGILQALTKQDAPLVQVALIDLLVDLKIKQAEPELRQLLQNAGDAGVRQRAEWALENLQ